MRMIILATLTTGFLVSGASVVLADCQTLAQAKASNPTAHLAYHLVAGTRCWFAGYPAPHDVSVAKKKAERVAPPSKADQSDQSGPAQALPNVGNEREIVEPLWGRLENAEVTRGVAEALNAVGSDMKSVPASQRRILDPADSAVELSEISQSPPQGAPPIRSAARYSTLVGWLLLSVVIGTTIIVILKLKRDRLVRDPESRHRARRIRTHDYPSAATPLVNHVDTRILDRNVFASRTAEARAWSNPRRRYAIGTWLGSFRAV